MPSPFGNLTLGEIIHALEPESGDAIVVFDWCAMAPGKLLSYRGYYDHLAISPESRKRVTVGDFLAECRAAIGRTYEGYKGGEYPMDQDTPVWVSQWGSASEWGVVRVKTDRYACTLLTQKIED